MSNIWFTSDPHYGHRNIIKYSHRPFLFDKQKGFVDQNLDVNAMDEALIQNHNSVVKPQDRVYFLGDFAFYKDQRKTIDVLRRLNGSKVLVCGNHDEYLSDDVLAMFSSVHDYLEINVPDKDNSRGKQKIVLLHYSMNVWNKSHHSSWHLFGHSHGSLADNPNSLSFDVGVDSHNYTPISYDQVKMIMAKKTFKPIDHHGE